MSELRLRSRLRGHRERATGTPAPCPRTGNRGNRRHAPTVPRQHCGYELIGVPADSKSNLLRHSRWRSEDQFLNERLLWQAGDVRKYSPSY